MSKKNVIRVFGVNLLVAIFSTMLCLFALEGAVRLLPKNYYEWHHRYLYYSEGAAINKYLLDGTSTVWYKPNTSIMTAAYYGYPLLGAKKVYVNWLTTNNIGLVQGSDFIRNQDSIALFGDSFTESKATVPWIYRLEQRFTDGDISYQILNLGYQGTGIGRWSQISDNLTTTLSIKKLIVVAISQDFTRLQQTGWDNSSLECIENSEKCQPTYYWQSASPDELTDKSLTAKSDYLIHQRHQHRSDKIKYAICGLSEIARQLSSALNTFCFPALSQAEYDKSEEEMGKGLVLFKKIIEKYGKNNVALVWVPERHEASKPRQSKLSDILFSFSKDNIKNGNFIECQLEPSDFLKKDGHPNETGAEKIYMCASQALTSFLK